MQMLTKLEQSVALHSRERHSISESQCSIARFPAWGLGHFEHGADFKSDLYAPHPVTTSTVIMRDHDDEHDQGLQIMIYEIMILNGARRHAGVIGVIMNVTVLIMIDHAMIWISIL